MSKRARDDEDDIDKLFGRMTLEGDDDEDEDESGNARKRARTKTDRDAEEALALAFSHLRMTKRARDNTGDDEDDAAEELQRKLKRLKVDAGVDFFSQLPITIRIAKIVRHLRPATVARYARLSRQAHAEAMELFRDLCEYQFRSPIAGAFLDIYMAAQQYVDGVKRTNADLYLYCNQKLRMASSMCHSALLLDMTPSYVPLLMVNGTTARLRGATVESVYAVSRPGRPGPSAFTPFAAELIASVGCVTHAAPARPVDTGIHYRWIQSIDEPLSAGKIVFVPRLRLPLAMRPASFAISAAVDYNDGNGDDQVWDETDAAIMTVTSQLVVAKVRVQARVIAYRKMTPGTSVVCVIEVMIIIDALDVDLAFAALPDYNNNNNNNSGQSGSSNYASDSVASLLRRKAEENNPRDRTATDFSLIDRTADKTPPGSYAFITDAESGLPILFD